MVVVLVVVEVASLLVVVVAVDDDDDDCDVPEEKTNVNKQLIKNVNKLVK